MKRSEVIKEIEKEFEVKETKEKITIKELKGKFKESYGLIIKSLKKYIDMREDYYSLVSLWVMGTYIHKVFGTYPYLYFNAMKGSGKSRTLGLIAHLSYKGKMVVNMSEAVLFRTAQDSTICIDEFERTKGKEKANLRELLNAAYKKGIIVERAKKVKECSGEGFEIEKFNVFCPIVMANISGMDDVLGDRSIKLTLEKTQLDTISRKLEIWGLDEGIKQILELLSVECVDVELILTHTQNLYQKWNSILETTITNSTLDTNNKHDTHDTTLLLNKIIDTTLNGRHLELFFPLFIIADFCGEIDKVIKIAEGIIKEKKEEDVYENRDVSLIDFVSRKKDSNEWIPQKQILNEFKEFIEAEEDKWVNSQWLGLALSRLNLIKAKQRRGRGRDIILNVKKAQEKIKMFK